jgi:hypothetical protein
VIAVEESQERSLGTGRTLDASEAEVRPRSLQVSQVPQQLLDPEGSSLADSRQLSWLEVGEAEGGQVTVLLGEGGQAGDDDGELGQKDVETLSEEDEVGVAAVSGGMRLTCNVTHSVT